MCLDVNLSLKIYKNLKIERNISINLFTGAHFLKSVINFVRSNDIQCEFCIDKSNEILSLLYYRDCFNLWREGYNINFKI